jgi:putative thioredoxin
MTSSEYIIDVNEADFDVQVLAFSQQAPVVVDFWAEWCAPCRVLGPILEKLAVEGQGTFRLAKINVDENQNLAKRYQIRSIPAVKAFRDGRPVAEFSGVRPEAQVREFLRNFAPSEEDLNLAKGYALLQSHNPHEAELAFRQVLEHSDHPSALLGLSRTLLLQGQRQESYSILRNFPASREFQSAEKLYPLAEALINYNPTDELSSEPLDAAYQNALRLLYRKNLEAAMDGLLDILREDKHYRSGKAQKLLLAIFELIGEEDPTTHQYRNELASILF